MDHAFRVGRADDARFLATDELVWCAEPNTDTLAGALLGLPADQRFAAEYADSSVDTDPDTYPGVYGVRPLELSVPDGAGAGRLIPAAGLTWVGVHPDHRRRGVLTAMLRHHLHQCQRDGLVMSTLMASEPGIYGRHGYGMAVVEQLVTLARGTTLTAPGLDAEVDQITTALVAARDDSMVDRIRRCAARVARSAPGSIVLWPGFYRELMRETAAALRNKESRRFLFARLGGEDVGLATFRREHRWERGRPDGIVHVGMLLGSPAAKLALLRRLLALDLMGQVELPMVGADDPIWEWIGPRGESAALPRDNLWLRIIDLPGALTARGYEDDCDVVVEVSDAQAPWNAGRWRLQIRSGEAAVSPTQAAADLVMPIDQLSAAYLGGVNLVARHRAGLLIERTPGAALSLWRALRTSVAPSPAPGF